MKLYQIWLRFGEGTNVIIWQVRPMYDVRSRIMVLPVVAIMVNSATLILSCGVCYYALFLFGYPSPPMSVSFPRSFAQIDLSVLTWR